MWKPLAGLGRHGEQRADQRSVVAGACTSAVVMPVPSVAFGVKQKPDCLHEARCSRFADEI
jgi:hypothetical protein